MEGSAAGGSELADPAERQGEIEHQRWQEGYEAAVNQVRIAGSMGVQGNGGNALRGMATTLDATRDEIEVKSCQDWEGA